MSMPQVESMEITTPKPFYKVQFEYLPCTLSAVLTKIEELYNKHTLESFRDKHLFEEFCSEIRDSGGCLTKIHLRKNVYCQEVQEYLTEFISAVKKEFGIPTSEEIDKLDIHFTMW